MDVARWVPVSNRWVEHRAEPLIRERLWGCDIPLPDEVLARAEFWAEAGFDADGRPVAFRERSRHDGGEPDPDEVVTVERQPDGTVVVHLAEGGEARTTFNAAGQPERTVYVDEDGEEAEELYHYDAAGRLVAIDESEGLWSTQHTSERFDTGGRLTVKYDDTGATQITCDDGEVVWERPRQLWERRLKQAAEVMAAKYRALIAPAMSEAGLSADLESYGCSLVYVDQGQLHAMFMVGVEEQRKAAGGGEEGAIAALYVGDELLWIQEDVLSDEESTALLREASMAQADDPYRVVLGEVARLLAAGDLPGITKTPDFVAWVAEHDEGLAEKVSSIRIHNSPEAVARWEAGWGGQVLPFTHD